MTMVIRSFNKRFNRVPRSGNNTVSGLVEWHVALYIIAVLALCLSCKGTNEKGLNFSVNGVEYSTSGLTCDTLDLTKLSTEIEADISIKNYDDYDAITIDGRVVEDGKAFVPVRKIAKNHFLTLITTKGEKSDTLYLRTMHSDLPDVVIDGDKVSDGEFYLSFVNIRLIARINNAGKYVFYSYEPTETIDTTKCPGWWDFKKHVCDDGETYYSYHAPDVNHIDDGFPGYNPGMRVIFGKDYFKVDSNKVYIPYKTIQLKEDTAHGVKERDPIDGHDFYMYDFNHYIVSSYIKKQLPDGEYVYAAYLQEIRNDSLLFAWCSTDHPEMEGWLDPAFAPDSGNIQQDYVHFNSIDVLPDGNWLCSFRHISSILKINRNSGKGEIMWRIAGAEDSLFSFHGQHYVRYHEGDNSITLFNNGNLPDSIGRTQMLRLNVDTCTGKVLKSTVLHDDGYFTQACGALTFSGKNMIVGWGIPGDNNSVNCDRILSEYDENGAEVFSIRFKQNDSSMNQYLGSYRCVKCE